MRRLYTKEGEELPEIPWNDYPRPQMQREEWLCLNGEWKFSVPGWLPRRICVPFCPESLLSGIQVPPEIGTEMVYEREFELPEMWKGKHILLHFGAVSRECRVHVNGREVCCHNNAYLPFSADITDAIISGSNQIKVSVINDLSPKYSWGKQSRNRGGMWYTPVSGIWQTVWLEPVPQKWIQDLKIRTGPDYAEIQISGCEDGYIEFDARKIPFENGKALVNVEDPIHWSPENPHLYWFTVVCGDDRVKSYFALRSLTVEQFNGIKMLCLNGKPYFFNGLLDQGYWSDGLYTPAAPVAFENDILAMKSLGFNTLRKHIKIELERFYFDCDRLGMVVFQDMVNNGEYNYLRDTVLPTLGVLKQRDENLNPDPETRNEFLKMMEETARHLQNHPCICLWTIFNEGWGQFCADEAYRRLKAIDGDCFVDSTSGWFHQNLSDVDSLHIYFRKLRLGADDHPHLLSEFGGFSYKIPEHSFNLKKTYGYRKYVDRELFVKGLQELYKEVRELAENGLSGAVYTQVSDVEDETNGLFTFDRKVLKVHPKELLPVMLEIFSAAARCCCNSAAQEPEKHELGRNHTTIIGEQ